MQTDYCFGSPVVTVAWIVAVAVVISGAAVAISHRWGADRAAIVERLEVVWLIAALGAVALLTLQPGPGGFGSTLPPLLDPVSSATLGDTVANIVLYVPVGLFATLVCMLVARLRHSFFGEEELMTMVIAGWMANELAPFLSRRACGDTECAHPSCAEVRMLAAATGANRIETALLPLLEERIWISRCNRRRVSTSIPVRSKMCYSSIPRWSMPV